MTTPTERTRAVNQMGAEVLELHKYMHGKGETARVPRETIRCLVQWLRHYPTPSELELTAEAAPHLWGKSETTVCVRQTHNSNYQTCPDNTHAPRS